MLYIVGIIRMYLLTPLYAKPSIFSLVTLILLESSLSLESSSLYKNIEHSGGQF